MPSGRPIIIQNCRKLLKLSNATVTTALVSSGTNEKLSCLSRSKGPKIAQLNGSLSIESTLGRGSKIVIKVPLTLDALHWKLTPWHLTTDDTATITTFLTTIQEGEALTLKGGRQVVSLAGLKAALLFIDSQQKRVGSETAWIKKGDDPPLSVPPAPALKKVAVVNPTPTPLTHEELNDLLDYGSWRMNNAQCSLDPNRREVRVTALTDDKALLVISCEAGAYNTVHKNVIQGDLNVPTGYAIS